MANKTAAAYSLDVDRLIREEVTEWFTSNRKGLENVFRKVADQVKQDTEAVWMQENGVLRERIRSMEEELKRARQILALVKNQVTDEEERQAG